MTTITLSTLETAKPAGERRATAWSSLLRPVPRGMCRDPVPRAQLGIDLDLEWQTGEAGDPPRWGRGQGPPIRVWGSTRRGGCWLTMLTSVARR